MLDTGTGKRGDAPGGDSPARHVFVKPCLELQFDNMGSVKAGKRTNQCILAVEAGEET